MDSAASGSEATGAPWTAHPQDIADRLRSDLERGLTAPDAADRLAAKGFNEVDSGRETPAWQLLIRQFTNTMIVVLAVAGAITFIVGDRLDSAVILAIVVLNGVIGFLQEFRAERSMAALQRMTATQALAVRDGLAVKVDASELVPGDLVRLATGDIVPADVRLTEVNDLQVEEAVLTGESVAITKSARPLPDDPVVIVADRTNMAHKGTAVVHGRADGIVVATGTETEIGRISEMLSDQSARTTPLQRRLASLGRRTAAASVLVCLVVFGAGLARGEPIEEMFITAVSLAVAAIPEGLPAVVTVALAVGARRMAGRNALVRRLLAVETLGSVTVICTDKTGTLTQNRMAVEQIWTPRGRYTVRGVGYDPVGDVSGPPEDDDDHLAALAKVAVYCNDARIGRAADSDSWSLVGDPTEGALLTMSARLGVDLDRIGETHRRIGEVPFDTNRRRMSTIHRNADRTWVATKGALDAIAPFVRAEDGATLERAVLAADELAALGFRVLALATRELPASELGDGFDDAEQDLHLLGIVGITDPPRPSAADAIDQCRGAGVATVMVTGDHPRTALAIGRRLGLLDHTAGAVLTGAQLDQLDDTELAASVEDIRVYARTTPEHKLRIVSAWQDLGHTVAMTGDGVNDAPALQRADIGVAMGISGSDVSKEAADLVLADDDFGTIVGAIEEGRRIYDNVRRFIRYLLATNSGEVLLMVVAPVLGLPVPLTAPQILWVNLVTDGLPAIALGLEPTEDDAMRRDPRPPQESILGRGLWQHAAWVGALMASVAIAVQATSRSLDWPWPTMVFTSVAFLQLGHALAVRSERRSLLQLGLRSNPWLAGAIVASVGLQLATIYLPFLHGAFDTEALSPLQLLVVTAVSTTAFCAVEVAKWIHRRRPDGRSRIEGPFGPAPVPTAGRS